MEGRRKAGRWIAVGAAVLACACAPATAGAQERVELVARALERDPVYVSDSLARAVPPEDRERLRRAAEAAPFPVYVVMMPYFSDEPGLETWNDLPALLQDRVRREGVYVVSDGGSMLDIEPYRVDVEVPGDLYSWVIDDVDREDGPVARIEYALALMQGAERETPLSAKLEPARDVIPWIVFGVMATVTLTGPVLLVRRRRPHAAAGALEAPPRAARREAQEALSALARALSDAPDPPEHAFEAYRAASKASAEGGPLDHVGALVLARRGLAALRGADEPPCIFNPLHESERRPTRWRRGGEQVLIPACRECREALEAGRRPCALGDGDRAYYERDGVWARTGFGALDPDVVNEVLRA